MIQQVQAWAHIQRKFKICTHPQVHCGTSTIPKTLKQPKLPIPSPGELPDPGIKPGSSAL